MDPFADVSDVEADWGDLTVAETAQVATWLATASNSLRLIGRKRGVDVDALIAGDPVLEQAATDAVVSCVRRRLMNPSGVRQRSTTTTSGPYTDSSSETIDSAVSTGGLHFTDDDLVWLPTAVRRRFGSFTVRSGFRS
jgi:hypothetical protein